MPNVADPHDFGPPGSGSVSQSYGSFYHQAKLRKKNLDSYGFVTSSWTCNFETWCKLYLQKVISKNIFANPFILFLSKLRAAIQRRGSKLSWSVILSVYGADTIAIDLSLSALISWFIKSIFVFLNNANLHVIISTLFIIIYIDFKFNK